MTADTSTAGYAPMAESFTAVVDSITDWDAPCGCAGWTAADLLGHVIDTQRDFLSRHDVSLPEVGQIRDAPTWRAHDAAVRAQLADPAVAGHAFDGAFGPTTIGETMVRFYGWDLLVHRWDLTALRAGERAIFSDAELDTIDGGADFFGDMLYAEGICRPALTPPPDADRQARILARLGRSDVL